MRNSLKILKILKRHVSNSIIFLEFSYKIVKYFSLLTFSLSSNINKKSNWHSICIFQGFYKQNTSNISKCILNSMFLYISKVPNLLVSLFYSQFCHPICGYNRVGCLSVSTTLTFSRPAKWRPAK